TDPPPADTTLSTTPSPATVTELPIGEQPAEQITLVDGADPTDPADRTEENLNRAGATDQTSAAPDGTTSPSPLPAETATLPPAGIPAQDRDGPLPTPTDPEAPGGEDTRTQPGPTEIRLILLDRPHLRRADQTVYQGRLSLEIAGYLALHRTGATTTTLISALLPDADPDRARDQIYQAIRRLREAFRRAGAGQILLSDRGGYQLASTLSCDLWDIEKALAAADRATDDDSRVAALRTATGLYTGRLLDGCEWATAHATHLEHRLIDAAADLADLLADTHPTDAAAVLDHALTHHPYTESLYT
ncbi:BTAD domain-containing putative transcriptional regulator, partial [Frankia canadensis]|uniref:BTAD domain-containing putative transcriptional regulator n=1 Tax=Frankia canadensis TaxID=1836972 RepID=UPI002435A243